MSGAELLAVTLALAALATAIAAFSRASTASRARAELGEFIRAQQQTDIQVLFLKRASGQYNLTLANRGASSARNIVLQVLDDLPAARNPLRDAGGRLPVPQLDPGGYFQLPVPVDEQTPTHFRLRARWTNAGGLETVKDIPLNLLE
jgi:hypothetical protein